MNKLSESELELIKTSILNAEYSLGVLHGILRPSKAEHFTMEDEDLVIQHLAKVESRMESIREYFPNS